MTGWLLFAVLAALTLSCHFRDGSFTSKAKAPKAESDPEPVSGPTVLPLSVIDLTAKPPEPGKIQKYVAWTAQELLPFEIGVVVFRVQHEPLHGTVKILEGKDPRLTSRLLHDGTVTVFVVDEIVLKGDAKNGFQAVHEDQPFVVVEKTAASITWAHEIGHLLELGHDPSVANIMCSCDTSRKDPHFSPEQGEAMRSEARRLVLASWAKRP